MQVVKKGKVQLQNRLVPDGPVQGWTRRIEELQPDIDRVLQVILCLPRHMLCTLAVTAAGFLVMKSFLSLLLLLQICQVIREMRVV